MTRDEILRMAREAGLYVEPHRGGNWAVPLVPDLPERVERFAALVAAAEREACAELIWPTRQIKIWSDESLEAMTKAFNQAQEKHGWYETLMAVGAVALKDRAAAIRSRRSN